MKPFANGTKVEVLYSAGDNAPAWVPATVVNQVKPNMLGWGEGGNVVKVDDTPKGKGYVTVTEPGMIRNA